MDEAADQQRKQDWGDGPSPQTLAAANGFHANSWRRCLWSWGEGSDHNHGWFLVDTMVGIQIEPIGLLRIARCEAAWGEGTGSPYL
ncbi:MAG: hypothetical protein ACK43N_06550, partial [Pirellulaceae bacterium]